MLTGREETGQLTLQTKPKPQSTLNRRLTPKTMHLFLTKHLTLLSRLDQALTLKTILRTTQTVEIQPLEL